jgi:hypothetical protein
MLLFGRLMKDFRKKNSKIQKIQKKKNQLKIYLVEFLNFELLLNFMAFYFFLAPFTGAAACFFFVPYFERDFLRPFTPAVSNAPRTIV